MHQQRSSGPPTSQWTPTPGAVDYLFRPLPPSLPDAAVPLWADQLAATPRAPAGVVYLQLGPWPPWVHYLLSSASRNKLVTFYFVGMPLAATSGAVCTNCVWLPMRATDLISRIRNRLGPSLSSISPQKLNDLKPMCGALLPELSSRHKWFGYSDPDVLFGNLSAEVVPARTQPTLRMNNALYIQQPAWCVAHRTTMCPHARACPSKPSFAGTTAL